MFMLTQILSHTPTWVFGLLALLIAYGITQLWSRQMGVGRVIGVAAGMALLGGSGVATAFGVSLELLLAWGLAAAGLAALVQRIPLAAAARYDADSQRLHVPGSVVPLLLMMGIFASKFCVGVALAMHPQLHAELGFALVVALLSGAFSGIFAGRAARLWKLART